MGFPHFFPVFIQFSAGVMLYRYRTAPALLSPAGTLIASLAVFCAGAVITSQLYNGHVDTQPVGIRGLVRVASYLVASVLLLCCLLSLEYRKPASYANVGSAFLVRIGTASFGLYLLHLLVFAVISFLLSRLHVIEVFAWPVLVVSLVAAIAAALIWFSRCEPLLTSLTTQLSSRLFSFGKAAT